MPKGKPLIIILLITLTVAAAGIPEVSAMAPNTRVRIEPAALAVHLNETFVVQVVIEEADNLGAFQFNLVYDPSILQVTEASLGDFLESTGNPAITTGPEVNNAEGRVTFWAVSLGNAPGPSGAGVLATITCIAQGEGGSDLELQDVQVLDTAASIQQVAVEGGRVVVGSAEAPTTPAATVTSVPTATATAAPATPTTSVPTTTATPAPGPTAPAAPTATATSIPTPTSRVIDTPPPVPTALPSPTPIVTSPAKETPIESPSPSPSISVAPTETKPTEAPSPTMPTVEATKAPAVMTIAPTSPPSPPPPSATSAPPPTPKPSPTPLPTISAPAATGPSGGALLGLMLATLAVAIVAIFILLSRRPEG
ncbi:MAG: hypothetical protein H8E47_00810 [Anaerolineales bacterium]|nr:hypothetical protein [Anaerolineales bacterium]